MTNIAVSERIKWVGASEVAALFGASRFVTRFELFHLKRGNIPPADLDGNDRVQAGIHLEPGIAAWASEKWNWPLRNVKEYIPHQSVERFGCSLDFEAIDGGEPVEIKAIDYSVFRDGEWESDGETLLDAPVDYLLQVQAQLACKSGAQRGWLVVCVGGNKLYRMEIPRHEKMIARIEREVTAFWADVLAGNEPAPDFEQDASTISLLYGGKGDEIIDLRGNERVTELCAEYRAGLEVEKEGEARKKAALAEIKTLMNDAQGALVDGGFKVKASFTKESTSVRSAHWRFSITQKKQEK